MRARGRPLRILLLTLWSVGGGLVLLALMEAGLRIADVAPDPAASSSVPPWMDEAAYRMWQRAAERQGVDPAANLQQLPGWRWDAELRKVLEPDLRIRASNPFLDPGLGDASWWTLHTNSRGFRTPEIQPGPSAERIRVVTVGDSNTMGWALDAEDTYPRRLEAHLGTRLPLPVEVVNLGVGGYTSFSTRRVLEDVGLPLHPDAVVISCGANDPQRLPVPDAEHAERFGGPLGGLRNRLADLRLARLAGGVSTALAGEMPPRVSPEAYGQNLAAMFRAARRAGAEVVFLRVCCCLPEYRRQLADVSRRHGVPVIRSTEVVRRALSEGTVPGDLLAEVARWYEPEERRSDPDLLYEFRDDCHLNPLGAELVARALAEDLAPRLAD